MKILFLTRATLYSVFGGDTVQIVSTAKYLRKLGVQVDIHLGNKTIDYSEYDLLHVFNIIRPADILPHLLKSGKPYVLSTIFVDFTDYEHFHRNGLAGLITKKLSTDKLEYLKAWARWVKNGQPIHSSRYILQGHRNTVKQIAENAALILPNSSNEYKRFSDFYGITPPYRVIYNGIDPEIFDIAQPATKRQETLVICAARIEGNKNQLNLIKALNNTSFQLKIIGNPAPNHYRYYKECRAAAADNISFEGFVPQEKLISYYREAKVHVLPSWNETCGLSSLEAAYVGCNIVVTDRGDTTEYYEQDAYYCEPDNAASIFNAIERAAAAPVNDNLRQRILRKYNWLQAAQDTLTVYQQILHKQAFTTEGINYHTQMSRP
jgi:glycosyltransferase involved in cell wall biosynthesis